MNSQGTINQPENKSLINPHDVWQCASRTEDRGCSRGYQQMVELSSGHNIMVCPPNCRYWEAREK